MTEPAGSRPAEFGRWRRGAGSELVPSDDGAGFALAAVIAVLAFLAALAAGVADVAATSSAAWRSSLSSEATVQVRPAPGRELERDLARAAELSRETAGVADARAMPQTEAAALLEPWLGEGVDLSALPVPGLVVLRLAGGGPPDLGSLKARLAAEIPGAVIDDHGPWLRRLATVANGVVGVSIGFVALVFAAAGAAVAFATRGAMAGNRAVIDVLHVVGAADGFIAREFATRFVRLGFAGAAVGATAAGGILSLATLLSAGAAGAPALPMFGDFAPGPAGYLAIGLVAPALAGIAGLVSRASVQRFLNHPP